MRERETQTQTDRLIYKGREILHRRLPIVNLPAYIKGSFV